MLAMQYSVEEKSLLSSSSFRWVRVSFVVNFPFGGSWSHRF